MSRIVLDIDDTFDAVHGGQQLPLFNAHYDEYGFQPIVVFDGEGRMPISLNGKIFTGELAAVEPGRHTLTFRTPPMVRASGLDQRMLGIAMPVLRGL
jgi:hypothetical protein